MRFTPARLSKSGHVELQSSQAVYEAGSPTSPGSPSPRSGSPSLRSSSPTEEINNLNFSSDGEDDDNGEN